MLSQQAQPHAEPKHEDGEAQEQPQVSEQASNASVVTGITGATHKTLISALQKQLGEEKDARLKLEGELDQLKLLSKEI